MTRRGRWFVRLVRASLHLYPASFVKEFGAEMLATRVDAFRAEWHGRSGAGRLLLAARWAIDLVTSAVAEHAAHLTSRAALSPSVDPPSTPAVTWSHRMDSLAQDLRYALRSLARRPLFTVTVVATLALGIGANTAVFSLINAVLLRPVPLAHSNRIVGVYDGSLAGKNPYGGLSYLKYRDLVARNQSFDALAAYFTLDAAFNAGDRAEEIPVGLVTGNFFATLETRPALGRFLTAADDGTPGANPVAVLSDAFWKAHFHGDPATVGRQVSIGVDKFTVVGVAPDGFRGVELVHPPALWIPLSMHQSLGNLMFSKPVALRERGFSWLRAVGRLRAGVPLEQANADLHRIAVQLEGEFPDADNHRVGAPALNVVPITSAAALAGRGDLLRFVRVLLGVVLLTLAIACVNVTNLLLVRGAERARELSVRAAVGAARLRLIRQLLVESALLATAGGVAGLVIALLILRVFSSFTLPGNVVLHHLALGLDVRVLTFTLVVSLATALLSGVVPAIRATRADVAGTLRENDGRSAGRGPRGGLLAVQIAMSLVLLTGALLFLRSLRAGLHTDLGFDPGRLAAASIDPGIHQYTDVQETALFRNVLASVTQLPGVTSAAIASHIPLALMSRLPFAKGPAAPRTGPQRPLIPLSFASVSRDYFRVLGVDLVEGRSFIEADEVTSSIKPLVINQSAARALWPNESAVGKALSFFGTSGYIVIGVVRDTKYESLTDQAVPAVFSSIFQDPIGAVSVVVRGAAPGALVEPLARAVRQADPKVPVLSARVVSEQLDEALMPQRFGAWLLSLFSLVALAISAVGIYGTVAYTVSQRTVEIGIRLALGAQARHIFGVVLARSGSAMLLGILAGLVGAVASTTMLRHFLYGIDPADPALFAVALGVLSATAVAVALIPARRALRIHPMRAIRRS